MRNFIKNNYILLGIMGIAAFFRLWLIQYYPGGLFPDEAANGLDINSIFNGDIQPFYERGNGREALFFYFLAIPVAIFGRGPWQHHIISAGFGIVEVLAAYFLTKRMFGQRTAYLASFFMAVSSYAVTLSRTAFRANTIPLFTTLTLLFLVKFFQSKDPKEKAWSAFFAGISFGLGFYTYISYRMMIPLLLMFAVLLLFSQRTRIKKIFKEYLKPKLIFAGGFVLSFAWLGYYFITHPGSFIGRAGQVSVFNEDLNKGDLVGTVIEVFRLTMISFFKNGDLNWRHNVSGYPFLSEFISPFFGIVLIFFTWSIFKLLKQSWDKKIKEQTVYQALVASWFWLMLVPEITTAEGIPHGLRLIGVIPAIFILSAYGVNKFWEKISPKLKLDFSRIGLPAVFLGSIFVYNFYLYFGVAAASSEYYYAFRSDLTRVSHYLNNRNNKDSTYLSLDKFSVQTVDYLTTETNQPFTLLVPEKTYEVRLKSGDQVVFTQSTLFDIAKFKQNHPDTKLFYEEKNQFGQTVLRVYVQP